VFYELLRFKVVEGVDILHYLKPIPRSVEYYLVKGLEKIGEIRFAKPFTRYAWLLVLYLAFGKIHDSKVIIYYNVREPRWSLSSLIHELIHASIGVERRGKSDIIVDETYAYLASYQSGYRDLYLKGDNDIIRYFSRDKVMVPDDPQFQIDLVNIVIPRILANRLTIYDYDYVVKATNYSLNELIGLWLKTNPNDTEIKALSNTLKLAGFKPYDYNLIDTSASFVEKSGETVYYGIEGVDEKYLEMIRILRKAVENPSKISEILAPWWSELNDLPEINVLHLIPLDYFPNV